MNLNHIALVSASEEHADRFRTESGKKHLIVFSLGTPCLCGEIILNGYLFVQHYISPVTAGRQAGVNL
ncbi:MAG: hypothetical protein ABIK68_10605 [bacterium]